MSIKTPEIMKQSIIFHPETKKLSGTIIRLDTPTQFGDKFETNVVGCKDWFPTFNDARDQLESDLNELFNGTFYGGTCSEKRYFDAISTHMERHSF